VPVVVEHAQVKLREQAIGGVGGDHVDLLLLERLIEQP